MAAKCRGCGAAIVWIKTAAGKPMPCDPVPLPYWARAGAKEKIVTKNGEVVSCDLSGEAGTATGLGFIPNWATCPERDRFKKKGAKP